ncbi:MAG: hypothetical protein IJY57_02005 [Clostridia bacterium]|nr:hypothetical protein [Clostridia bacterium]
MKNQSVKKYLISLLIVLFSAFTVLGFSLFGGNDKKDGSSFVTKGVYTAFAAELEGRNDTNTVKEIKSKLSTDGKYMLLVSAFDDAILNQNGLYYIGYDYTLNGNKIDSTQLENAKTSTYYEGVTLTTAGGESTLYAKDIYANAEYENLSLIVHEVEFETSYDADGGIQLVQAFIKEMEEDGLGGYQEVSSFKSEVQKLKSEFVLENGSFEDGLTGWTKVGNIGDIDTATHYWLNDIESASGFEFGMVGEKMFSAYAPGASEASVGTLTSSTFKVGGSGFATYKLGAMRDGEYCYIDVVEASTGNILARYFNNAWQEKTDGIKSGCTLVPYKVNLQEFMGKTVYFRLSDNADSGYGLFFVDDFVTFYKTEPENFNLAVPVSYALPKTIYDLTNGGFEMGSLAGWWNNGNIGRVTNADAYFNGVAYGKDGSFLFSGVQDLNGEFMEGNVGTLTSSTFMVGGSNWISFMLGGASNEQCYVLIIDAVSGEILAKYRNTQFEDAILKQFYADLTAFSGRTVRIQLVDYATNSWGCASFDNVVTHYANVPEGANSTNTAVDCKYAAGHIANGSFETGNLAGWSMNMTSGDKLGGVLSAEREEGWYHVNNDTKDGNNLFTFYYNPEGNFINYENGMGNLQSSNFALKQNTYVSFKFGGAGGGINHDVYIELCKLDGTVVARFYNDADGKLDTRMNSYFYQYTGEDANCYFRVVDNSTGGGGYGCFVVDDFRANLESAPDGFIPACV